MKTKLMALGLGVLDALAIAMIRADRVTTESDQFSHDLLSVSAPAVFFGLISVWFAETLGNYVGPTPRGGYVDETTPPLFFVAFGWFLLSIPVLLFFFVILVLKTWS